MNIIDRRVSPPLSNRLLAVKRTCICGPKPSNRLSLHLPPPYLPPIPIPPALPPFPILPPIPHPPCSRGITDVAIMSSVGPRPNCSIKAATDPAALAMYANADKILCF